MAYAYRIVPVPVLWLFTGGIGVLSGIVFGGMWLAKQVGQEAYARGLLAGRMEEQVKGKRDKDEESEESDSEDESEFEAQELDPFNDRNEECKLILVVRTDLKMGQGKVAAQCGHATLACYKAFLRTAPNSPVLKRWEHYGQMKVALKCTSEDEMQMLQAQALSLGLCAQIIHDAGRTQIAAGSATVLGIGPGPVSVINQVTGGLKLL
ncbi:One of two mitochondrially-localized peptidyl-tRNA hydrolase [Phyllosticta citriasiana]|uniref:peptidyl-tRNA hydrolase n=1 Tax=Phyllosticta citriasiana TaxID=595635 RepID=A0ABR1KPA2_9PEZI